ncbi:hypothetical protein SAMN06265367_101773 [Algoriphagus winogradskyi]|uniref:Threonine synthase n=2 Tax=Algoriphagus winogradskyi TaxID=237017 RepID=A0ABY1NG23_9BACT|nr:hypothetical protein SAMN06265367_101773 [Algoriphagus winogradskyi]
MLFSKSFSGTFTLMKNFILVSLLLFGLSACGAQDEKQYDLKKQRIPQELWDVLEAHGGIENWDQMKTLSFSIPKEGFDEVHTIDLHSRMDRVVAPAYDIGFDGVSAWSLNKAEEYKGDPSFRHDLMFYFYAMPFVLADEGINYETAEPMVYEGISYPGVKITYQANVGEAPEDIYLLHYHPETKKMAWLGYKATFGEELKPGPPSWIRYDEWAEVNGVSLPTSIAWQKLEDGEIVGERNRVNFTNISLSKDSKESSFYKKDGAVD